MSHSEGKRWDANPHYSARHIPCPGVPLIRTNDTNSLFLSLMINELTNHYSPCDYIVFLQYTETYGDTLMISKILDYKQ